MVRIKLIFTCLFLGMSQMACSQQNVVILKKCFSEGQESFPSKNYTCEKLFFNGQKLSYKINYSSNGWQIVDSVSYQIEGSKLCAKSYQPLYDIENRRVTDYQLNSVDCNPNEVLSNDRLSQINDKFYLSREYLAALNFLLSKDPKQTDNGFLFDGGIIPSLFTQYGIPYDEPLSTFDFTIEDGVIKSDSFVYENYVLKREYEYKSRMLEEVKIVVTNRKGVETSEYREYFEIE